MEPDPVGLAHLAERLKAQSPLYVQSVEVAGPGFVNFHLDDTWLF